jgi:MoaA/NifB/PqqE/SkfB family radical SAM enzyme
MVVHWMVGLPDETRAEIRATLQAALALFDATGARPLVQFAIPIRGTELHRDVTARNLWTTREDRDIGPLFQGQPVLQGPDWTAHELAVARQVVEARVEASRPRKVIVNTTYVCNNHCAFCATGNRMDRHGDPDEQIRFLRERRAQGIELVDFDGGEPTTNPHLLRLIAAARDLGYRAINLTTNGRMLAVPRNAERIVRSGITHLLVSLHGPNALIHEDNVGSAGAFAQTTAGIANARPLADRLGVGFGVNVTLTRRNTPHLLEMGPLLERLGVTACNLQFLTPFGRASAECQPDPAEAARQAMALIQRHGQRIRFQIVNLPLCFLPGHETYGLADLGKLERHMVFVGGEDVNLLDYLQARRRHEAACETCLFAVACEGFYPFPDEWRDEARARFGD